jgi:acylphosphatase
MEKQCIKAVVHGAVQGVSFRYYTRKTATALNLVGWVKNLPDGTVALQATGDPDALKKLAAWLQHGPPFARVSKVDIIWSSPEITPSSFDIVY